MSILSDIKYNLFNKKYKVVNAPGKFFSATPKVTVVTPLYNSEEFISKTIESVINQSIGFDNIQYIIVDDKSNDNSREIVQEYADKYKNITFIKLQENTGSPSTPRNIGIDFAIGKYITFLDADDWFHSRGIEVLYNILEETDDDYAEGKTIKVETGGKESIIGEYASIKERRSISPFEVDHFFYHMGPRSRMVKLSLVKENNITFPDMKFAEDKTFFFDVFFHANKVSTTVHPVQYVNRSDQNSKSLTKTTDVIYKRYCDLKVINYIKEKKLPVEKEKTALNRIYEYDILRTFNSMVFINSKEKEKFFQMLNDVINTTKDLRYDFTEPFESSLYKLAVQLFIEGRVEDFVNLFRWSKKDKNKKYIIKDKKAFLEIPFLEEPIKRIEIPLFARAIDSYVIDKVYYQTVEVYGKAVQNINNILIRDRKRVGNDLILDFEVKNDILKFNVDVEKINEIKNSTFTIFIRYNDYQLINIKRILKNSISYQDKKYEFYTSQDNNLSLVIK
ncbi:glycosyltransferase family 2 protein [Oceanobacillus sp. J11TS1]|uniref:glycosyltransferase family 2 protein n=1 Tax=Oceanobacillus sp. J11TS1 TaxID=2807191 RepID=UPI001B0497B9|nr:glycosyltransferase family 2 protein [Oceanobacillus sp. J11TS1]GIO23406.1 hypothetical protein J11TS1_19870 [Oceanobacillus sp. J11TS1]